MLVDQGTLSAGAHRWIESQVDHRRTRWVLTAILGVSVVGHVLLIGELIRVHRRDNARVPYVVTLDNFGNAKPVPGSQLVLSPTEALVRNHLHKFAHAYYARLHGQVGELQSDAYWFFHRSISSKMAQVNRAEVAEFVKNERSNETEIDVTNVISHLDTLPYSADIYFTKKILDSTKAVISTEKWTAKVQFEFAPRIAPAMVNVNALGLAITYIRQEKEF